MNKKQYNFSVDLIIYFDSDKKEIRKTRNQISESKN